MLYLELLFALGILWRQGLLKTSMERTAAISMVALAFVLRYCCLTYETLDYQDWIRVWIDSLRQTGPWKGLGQEIWSCNYNVPYLYFLAIFSQSSIYDLLLVKLLSILFDVLLAWAVMELVGLFTQSPARRLTAFIGVLWLPTVYLNGALWGQCDVIYATFAVLSVYLMLSGRPCWSIAAIAVSVSFKLQAIFLLPAYFLFLIAKRVKLWQLLIFPLTYVATILPAVLAGRSFLELLTLYYNNTSTIGDGLNYNSSSLYALLNFDGMSTQAAGRIGIVLAFFLCAGVYVWLLIRRDDIDDRALLGVCVLFCIGVPFLLPHMHDRYFFMADVLTFALAVIAPAMSLTPVLVSFGSLLGYHAYLKMRYLLPMRYGSLAMVTALVLTTGYVAHCLNTGKKQLTNTEDLI
jgi:Gpi18-like mannosyltransferase